MLDGTQIMRSNIDAKQLRFGDDPTLISLGCPKEALEMLDMLTEENIVEIFEGKTEYSPPSAKRETRQATRASLEIDDLINDLEADLDTDDLKNERMVTFDI